MTPPKQTETAVDQVINQLSATENGTGIGLGNLGNLPHTVPHTTAPAPLDHPVSSPHDVGNFATSPDNGKPITINLTVPGSDNGQYHPTTPSDVTPEKGEPLPDLTKSDDFGVGLDGKAGDGLHDLTQIDDDTILWKVDGVTTELTLNFDNLPSNTVGLHEEFVLNISYSEDAQNGPTNPHGGGVVPGLEFPGSDAGEHDIGVSGLHDTSSDAFIL